MTAKKEILVHIGFVIAFWIIANLIVSFVYWMNLVLNNVEVDNTYAPNLFFILVILYVIDVVKDKYDSYKEEKEAESEDTVT